jgi:phosphatidylglycerophosphate synthase
MIDSKFRSRLDPLSEWAARPLVLLGMTPNQVTAAGLALVLLVSAFYLHHRSSLAFGLTLALAFAFDALDGAVARKRDMRTMAGGYFDAIADRYQELAVLAAIAQVSGQWALALLAFAGGVLTSYAKARAALEMPVSNRGWPDLFERLERAIYICVMLAADGIAASAGMASPWILQGGLAVYAGLTHLTAAQRINRAVAMLREADAIRR